MKFLNGAQQKTEKTTQKCVPTIIMYKKSEFEQGGTLIVL